MLIGMDEYLLITPDEWADVAAVASERDIELVYSHEEDGIHVYSDLEIVHWRTTINTT